MISPIANRDDEQQLFLLMLRGRVAERILLIEAPPRVGKTELLRIFAELSHKDSTVHINLKLATTGVAYIFWRIRESLGNDSFPNFEATLQRFTASVNVSNNLVVGHLDVQVAIGNDALHSKLRTQRLFEALIEDIRNINRQVVILFDAFDAADEELREWMTGSFLVAVAKMTPKVITVVAGQTVPPREIEWQTCCCKVQPLGPIEDEDAWYDLTQKLKLPLTFVQVQTAVRLGHGMPEDIQKSLQILVAHGSRRTARVSGQSPERRELTQLPPPVRNTPPQIRTSGAITERTLMIEQQLMR